MRRDERGDDVSWKNSLARSDDGEFRAAVWRLRERAKRRL